MAVTPETFAIVPAAGESRRMGRPKLMLPWRGRSLIEHVLAAWKASRVRATCVVVRQEDSELTRVAEAAGAIVVHPPIPPPDMRASVSFGLEAIRRIYNPSVDAAWLVAPADLPELSSLVIDRLISEHAAETNEALVPVVSGRRGHPVLLPWHWSPGINSLKADQGLNALLEAGPTKQIDCSDLLNINQLADIDTPDDYHRLRSDDAR